MKDISLIIIGTVPPPIGGDATWTYEYIQYAEQHNCDIRLVNTSIIGERANNVNDSYSLWDELRRSVGIWRSLNCEIRSKKPEVIHMNINCSPRGTIRDYITSLIIRWYKVPFVLHCHCNIEDQIGKGKLGKFLLRVICNRASKVITLNTVSYQYAYKFCKEKTIVIPNFIANESVSDQHHINEIIKEVLFVGHVKKTKGVDEILSVAKQFPDIMFKIAGPITEDYNEEYFQKNSPMNIKLLGKLDAKDVLAQLDVADVFMFPSYTEGFSLALLEAMARGIPCIATDVGSNLEMLENMGGIIVESKNAEQLGEALVRMSSENLRKKMSDWNICKVKDYYTIDSVFSKLQTLYREIIEKQ